MKILFLLKKNYNYKDYSSSKAAGLFNSATFVAEALERYLVGVKTVLEVCVDGNEIDKFIHKHRPNIVILEAIWTTPDKLRELTAIHKKIKFIIRVHSNIPFLAQEGMALTWIKEFYTIENVEVSFNNKETVEDFEAIDICGSYLPNIYAIDKIHRHHHLEENLSLRMLKYYVAQALPTIIDYTKGKEIINIGCFGAIRPLKNQLIQAMAAIGYAERAEKTLHFHINSTRVEQRGESVLKNIRAVFKGTRHKLIEHDWKTHHHFLKLIKEMDLGMQLSLSESFNIVTADFVSQDIPIIVSPEITWMPQISKTGPFNINKIIHKIGLALRFKDLFSDLATHKLKDFNFTSLEVWAKYLGKEILIEI